MSGISYVALAQKNLGFWGKEKKINELKVNTCSARPHVAAWVRRLHMCPHTVYRGWPGVALLFFVAIKRSSWKKKKKRAVDTQSRVRAVLYATNTSACLIFLLRESQSYLFIPYETSLLQFWQHQYLLDMFPQPCSSLMSAICLPDTVVLFRKLCSRVLCTWVFWISIRPSWKKGLSSLLPLRFLPLPEVFSEGFVFPQASANDGKASRVRISKPFELILWFFGY